MSGLAMLSGYGSDSDDDAEALVHTDVKMTTDTAAPLNTVAIKKEALPSALDLLGNTSTVKRKLPLETSLPFEVPAKISRIPMKKFIPPQVRSDRPNVVTEDTKHK